MSSPETKNQELIQNGENNSNESTSNQMQSIANCFEQRGPVIAGPGAIRNPESLLGLGLEKLSPGQQKLIERAQKYAMEQSVKEVIRKQNLALQLQQQKLAQRQQALILMCKLYVGSICFELGEDAIRKAFEPFGTITRIDLTIEPMLRRHRGFAFVEYDLPEGAYLALEQMNGAMLAGRPLKVVSRPSNLPQSQPIVDEIIEEAKQYNRIYVSSVKLEINDDDVQSVFEVFGKIKSCSMVRSVVKGQHKGYGFIEYETAKAAQDAIAAMNLFDLAGKLLRVGKAITPPNIFLTTAAATPFPKAVTMAAAAATARIQAYEAVASNVQAFVPSVKPQTVGSSQILPPTVLIPQNRTPGVNTPFFLQNNGQTVPLAIGIQNPISTIPPVVTIQPPVISLLPPKVIFPPTPIASIVTPSGSTPTSLTPASSFEISHEMPVEKVEEETPETEEPETLQQEEETMMIKGTKARYNLMKKLMKESRVVILKNAVGPEDIDDELKEEITEECENYGQVENVIIYQEKQSYEENSQIIVKIFVEFSTPENARQAKESLNGRYFGGRVVQADIYDQSLYDSNYFSG